MSPSEAPESDEPNCATASFSSAISSALIESGDLAILLVEVGDAGVDLLADRETLRTLLRTVTRQVGAADEGGEIVSPTMLHFDAALVDRDDFAGNDGVLAQISPDEAARRTRSLAELLDAERDALLVDVDVEQLTALTTSPLD